MSIDLEQRQRALDSNTSFIVQAPAGSGKTELLVQRFLVLLGQVQRYPEEIIALTFTRKAAAEMQERILQALRNARMPKPSAAHAIQTWELAQMVIARDSEFNWNLLNNPQRLRIQTIDALCAALIKRSPLLSGLGGEAKISSDANACYLAAARRLMTDLAESKSSALTVLLLHLDNQIAQLENLFSLMLTHRDQWLPYLISHRQQRSLEAFKQLLEQALSHITEEILCKCAESFPLHLTNEIIPLLNYAAENLTISGKNPKIAAWQNLSEFPRAEIQYLASWQAIANVLLTSEGDWRKAVNVTIGFPTTDKNIKTQMEELLATLQDKVNLRDALSALKIAPPIHYTENQWQIIAALAEVLPMLAAYLRMIFQERGEVDFLEISLATLQVLGENDRPSELALNLDYQIRHILVDEFQDTSITQFRLLEKLTAGWEAQDGRSLFVVGDPMQSIYRFRQAEVGLFLKAQYEGIGHLTLERIFLVANFRSDPKIITWINQNFSQLFTATPDISSGSVPYHSSTAMRTVDASADIQLHTIVEENGGQQAHAILNILNKALQENPQDSIAILVRRRSHLQQLIPLLKSAKIDFSAVEIESIAEQSIVLDLLALTSALLNIGDRLSWFAVLRSPNCGLTLADLTALASNNIRLPLLHSLVDFENNSLLSTDGKARLSHLVPLFLYSLNQRQRCSLRQWIENTWRMLQGPQCLRNTDEENIANNYFNLLQEWNANSDISDFISHIEQKRLTPEFQSTTKVHLMTIHKAKGLEFDRVIIPHLEAKDRAPDPQLLLWLDRPRAQQDNDLILAPIKSKSDSQDDIYQYLRRVDQEKSRLELIRLLYVGVTRSKKQLDLIANVKFKNDTIVPPAAGSFLNLLWNAFQPLSQSHSNVEKQEIQNEISTAPNFQRLFLSDFSHTFPVKESEVNFPAVYIENNESRYAGTIIHRCLQQIAQDGLSQWTKDKIHSQIPYWQQTLLNLGVNSAHLENHLTTIIAAIHHCLAAPRAQWLFASNVLEQKSEWALTVLINQLPQHIVIDRSFVDAEIRWIIDYKTSPKPETEIEIFLDQQQIQYQEKMHLYATAVRALDSRPIRLGLYYPLWGGWREWEHK